MKTSMFIFDGIPESEEISLFVLLRESIFLCADYGFFRINGPHYGESNCGPSPNAFIECYRLVPIYR